jgi:hypothetical protein
MTLLDPGAFIVTIVVKLPRTDFWLGITSGLPVIQPESSPALLKNSILQKTAKI